MRHKQRPLKSSRSVTFVIDGHTSFGDNNNPEQHGNSQQQHQLQQQSHNSTTKFGHQPIVPSASSNNNRIPNKRIVKATATSFDNQLGGHSSGGNANTSRQQYNNHINNNFDNQLYDLEEQDDNVDQDAFQRPSTASTLQIHDNINKALMRKQFEHNTTHMSDVMRLAFLENNDISIEDCSNIDFNSISTASILQRNIQQQLQQQRREQLRQQQQNDARDTQRNILARNSLGERSSVLRTNKEFAYDDDEEDPLSLDETYQNEEVVDESQSIPMGERTGKYQCVQQGCNRFFNSLRKLRHHGVIHSEEFPFVCDTRDTSRTLRDRETIAKRGALRANKDMVYVDDPLSLDDTFQDEEEVPDESQSVPMRDYTGKFPCVEPGCGKSFPSLRKLRHHRVVHSEDFPFVCEFRGCGKKFKRKFGIDLHSTTHFDLDPAMYSKTSNDSSLPFFGRRMQYSACKPCNQKFRTVHEYQYHMLKHGQEPFKCPVKGCGQNFSIWKSFQKHRASHYFNYRCKMDPSCDHSTSNLQLLKLHIYCCHFRRKLPNNATLASEDQNETSTKEESISVDDSQDRESVGEPSGIQTTKEMVYEEEPESSDETFQDEEVPDESPSVPVRDYTGKFPCVEPGCGKSFPSLRKLRHHRVVHSEDFPFVCEFRGCGKKFKRKFGIDLHSTTHFDLDPAMYSKTSNDSSLPFFGRRMQYSACKPCNQKFRTVHEYQYHMLKHGQEPFKCPVKGCGQNFSIWKSFQKHRASHYFNYRCKMDPSCDHSTSNLQLLKLHIYCCHFCRKLPNNATLASQDQNETSTKDESIDIDNSADTLDESHEDHQEQQPRNIFKEEPIEEPEETKPEPSTPRRDPRLRRNPPRSRAFGQQDNYAAVNNGTTFAKSLRSTPTKRTRSSMASSGSRSAPAPEKKTKLPLKVLPKRSAQRLPMSLIADDASTEEDEFQSKGGDTESIQNDRDDEDASSSSGSHGDPSQRNKFQCHLCDYKFSVRFQLTKHLSTHLELSPDMYSATADKQVVQISERRRRDFWCEKCDLKFEQMSDLDNHMKKHGARPYVCGFCQVTSSFRLAKQYLSHLYEHRFNYKCTMTPECEFTINRKDALKLHIFRMHLDQQLPTYLENYANMDVE